MSKEYPCIHYDGGKCKHFSDDKVTSYCVQGPCGGQVLSNANRIRTMSDEELVELLVMEKGGFYCAVCEIADQRECDMDCRGHCAKWLQQPAEEVHGNGRE